MAAGGNENDVQAFELDSVKLAAPTATHVLELLKGREAGVEVISSPGHPGMVPTIHIRGLGVAARMQPVYVLNGMRVWNLDGLDPGQIEKIEVLKNASAMGIWGADAARGVVLVETKKAHQGGFHVDYSGLGGVHFLSDSTATSFMHIHNLDLQYGGKKFSVYAGGSFLDNDGPYEGREDVHRRYSAALSANYTPFDWFSIGINGHWSDSQVDKAPDRWLESVISKKRATTYTPADISYTREDNRKEKAIQATAEFHPIAGLYFRLFAGIMKNTGDRKEIEWTIYAEPSDYSPDWCDATITNEDFTWKQYGAEAGYQTNLNGHKIHADIDFRRTDNKNELLALTGNSACEDYNLRPGDGDSVWGDFLYPSYIKLLEQINSGIIPFDSPIVSSFGDVIIPKWNEAVISLGYDYKERVKIDISASKVWEKSFTLEDDNFWTAAASLGWNVFKKPYLNLGASWSKTGKYTPFYTYVLEWNNLIRLPGAESYVRDFAKAEHFDVSASSSLNLGKNVLNLSAAWYKHHDILWSHFWGVLTFQGNLKSEELFRLEKQGIELSACLKGSAGDFRYSISGNLTFYGDVVRFGEKLTSPLEWEKGTRLYLQDGKHLGCSMTKDIYVEDGQLHSDDQDWNYSGAVFPNMAEALCVSLAWKRLQATISGHGRHGQSIRHNSRYDALYRYYRENAGIDKVLISSDAILSSNHSILDGSFFRIDQIRLDYSLPIKGKVSAGLYASLENWFLFTDYPGTDPEMSLAWDSIGVETARFPTTKRLIFGINLGF